MGIWSLLKYNIRAWLRERALKWTSRQSEESINAAAVQDPDQGHEELQEVTQIFPPRNIGNTMYQDTSTTTCQGAKADTIPTTLRRQFDSRSIDVFESSSGNASQSVVDWLTRLELTIDTNGEREVMSELHTRLRGEAFKAYMEVPRQERMSFEKVLDPMRCTICL